MTLQMDMAFHLEVKMEQGWREFAAGLPWNHYQQDPVWADAERNNAGRSNRRSSFFWVKDSGELKLVALGVERRLPIPGRSFWEFTRGPLVAEVDVLDEWLAWLRRRLGRAAARVRLQPALPLAEGGDEIETLLERHDFTRRRTLGGWTTLCIDTTADEEAIMSSFRPATQRAIRKALRASITAGGEDNGDGWRVLADLQTELATRAPVRGMSVAEVRRISQTWLKGGAGGTILIARHGHEPIAAALLISHAGRAYLPVIPSSIHHRDLPASHLVVWEAVRWAKHNGCREVDLVGYSMTARPGEAVWGINQFKRGFASIDSLRRFVAIHERIGSPWTAAAATAGRRCQRRFEQTLRSRRA